MILVQCRVFICLLELFPGDLTYRVYGNKKEIELGANVFQNPWVFFQNTTEILPYGLMAHDTIYTSFIQAWQSCHTYTRQFQYKGRN